MPTHDRARARSVHEEAPDVLQEPWLFCRASRVLAPEVGKCKDILLPDSEQVTWTHRDNRKTPRARAAAQG